MIDEDSILLWGHHLLLKVVDEYNDMIHKSLSIGDNVEFGKLFPEHLHSRNLLFNELFTKISHLISFDNKKVIQQAAAVQTLCLTYLTASKGNYTNFGIFPSAAL
eukprot:244552-Ditylum_brightwellii.AAC.1